MRGCYSDCAGDGKEGSCSGNRAAALMQGKLRDCIGLGFARKAIVLFCCLLHDQLHALVQIPMKEGFGEALAFKCGWALLGFITQWSGLFHAVDFGSGASSS